MAYHPFEQICSLWLERVKNHFVIENYPIRYDRKKTTKFSPSTATTDFDLISFNQKEPTILNLIECKSNINETFHSKSRTRILRQLSEITKHGRQLPFAKNVTEFRRWVFAIKIANRIKKTIPKNVDVIEGQDFENKVLRELIMLVASDPKIDPKNEILSIIRLFWHFGLFHNMFYRLRAKTIVQKKIGISAGELRRELGLISTDEKLQFSKKLLKQIKLAILKKKQR